MPFPRLPLQ